MHRPSTTLLLLPLLATTIKAATDCGASFTHCAPKGAASTPEPSIGPDLANLYVDIVHSVDATAQKSGKLSRRGLDAVLHGDGSVLSGRDVAVDVVAIGKRATSGGSNNGGGSGGNGGLCCADGTRCLLLQDLSLPFCYDTFTTNYFLPGGSTGQIVSGVFDSPSGASANLLIGNYTLADGTTGNVYGSPDSPAVPNTSTLVIPTQYTAAGSGSAIPATALGQEVTYTTTIPGTTIPATTIAEHVASVTTDVGGSTVGSSVVSVTEAVVQTDSGGSTTATNTVVEASTAPGSVVGASTVLSVFTQPATTIPGKTIAPLTKTIVTRIAGGTAGAASGSPTKTGAAAIIKVPGSLGEGAGLWTITLWVGFCGMLGMAL